MQRKKMQQNHMRKHKKIKITCREELQSWVASSKNFFNVTSLTNE